MEFYDRPEVSDQILRWGMVSLERLEGERWTKVVEIWDRDALEDGFLAVEEDPERVRLVECVRPILGTVAIYGGEG